MGTHRLLSLSRSLGSFFSFFLLVSTSAFAPAYGQWTELATNVVAAPTQHNGALRFHGGVAWAGTTPVGGTPSLAFSRDTGLTWKAITSFQTQFGISDIAIYDSLHVLVSTENSNVGSSGQGVFLTTDGGKAWTNILLGTDGNFSQVAFNGSPNDLYAIESDANEFFMSTDGGNTWNASATTTTTSTGSLCMAIAKDKTVYVQSYFNREGWLNASNDQGTTWSNDGNLTDGDSNGLAADSCDAQTLYLVNENTRQRSDGETRIDKTIDGGTTWQALDVHSLDFFSGAITNTLQAIYVGTVPGGGTGVQRSTDRGATWLSIGGPLEEFDTRTIAAVNSNILLVLDANGAIWRTMNSGGDSLTGSEGSGPGTLAISASPMNILQRVCDFPADTSISLAITGCGAETGALDSAWITGSQAFRLIDERNTPRALSIIDSIPFSYLHSGTDNAQIHLRYNVGSGTKDTAISLVGALGSPMITEPAIEHREDASAHFGETAQLAMAVDISSLVPYDSIWPFITDIQGTYTWDFSAVSYTGYTPPFGWHTTALSNTQGTVQFAIHKDTANWAQPLLLGTAEFTPITNSLLTRWVTLQNLSMTIGFNSSAVNVSLCLSEGEDNHWSVRTLGALSGVNKQMSSVLHLSCYPNPSRNSVWISTNEDLGLSTVEIYDMLGTKCDVSEESIEEGSPIELQLPQASGVYTIVIRSFNGTETLRAVKEE